MRRHLPRLLLTGALLSPASLYALGLGEIRLHSALNQPFDAEIELISPTPEELVSLKVGLASRDLYSRYELDRPAYLSNFDFSVSRTRDGRAAIRVTSNRSVTEPFVRLLVEASWARGRLLRDYTVLLDPPVFMPSQPEAAAAVATPQSGAGSEGRIDRPGLPDPVEAPRPTGAQTRAFEETEAPSEPAMTSEPAPVHAAAPDSRPAVSTPGDSASVDSRAGDSRPTDSISGDPTPADASSAWPVAAEGAAIIGAEYTVQRNDTLWRIASAVNPGSPATLNRTMIALFRANPAAFRGDNINRLRAGAVLRVPELAEIEAISAREATAEVARQTTEWSAALATSAGHDSKRLELQPAPESYEAPIAASPSEERKSEERKNTRVTPPKQAGAAASASGDRRLPVVNPELAAAQQSLGGAPEAPAAEPAAAAEEQASKPEAAGQPSEKKAAAQPARKPRPAPKVQPEPPAPSLGERIGQFWWVLVVAGLLVVIGLVIAVVRRRRDSDPGGPGSLEGLRFEPGFEGSAPRGREPIDELFDTFDSPAQPEARPVMTQREPAHTAGGAAAAATGPGSGAGGGSGSFDQQDALAEADFHMAYGLYDQAADLVKIALEREPGRRELKLKLLEIYFVWGAKDHFLDTARELHASRAQASAGEWDKVLIMGKQIAPEESMFQGGARGGMDLVDVNLEGGEHQVDVDLFAEPEAEKPAGLDLEFASGVRPALDLNMGADAADPAGGDLAGSDLDFLLDEPQRGAGDEADNTGSQSVRERRQAALRAGAEQTAELAIDDLDLDVSSLEQTGSLEDSQGITLPGLSDDELTQLAPSMRAFERGAQVPDSATSEGEIDIESTGTIYLDHVDLSQDAQSAGRPRTDATLELAAGLGGPGELDVDFDLSSGLEGSPETLERPRPGEADVFSMDVFAERTGQSARIDLDVGEPLLGDDDEPTDRTSTMELSEDEPVTMSEVGTKLDLARAYMDMGDPDGARSILEEVLTEGSAGQKQEAQRLIDSIS